MDATTGFIYKTIVYHIDWAISVSCALGFCLEIILYCYDFPSDYCDFAALAMALWLGGVVQRKKWQAR